MVGLPDVLLSLTANWFRAGGILAASVGGLLVVVHTGIPFRGDLGGKRRNRPYTVRVAKGIGSGNRLISASSLDWHDFGRT